MTKSKKYYWLKLKNDFFNQKEIKKLRKMAGGDTYVIIYLKMQLLSLTDGGKLIFEGIEENFVDELALELDEDVENVRMTVLYLEKHKLIEIIDDYEYLMTKVPSLIGTESESAERVRRYRERKALIDDETAKKTLLCNDNVTPSNASVTLSNTDIDIDIDKNIDIDINKEVKTDCGREIISLPLNDKSEYSIYEMVFKEFKELYPAVDIEQELRKMKGWLIANPSKRKTRRGVMRFVNSWLSRCQDSGQRNAGGGANGDTRKRDGSMYAEFS